MESRIPKRNRMWWVALFLLNLSGLAAILWRIEAHRLPPGEIVLVRATPSGETLSTGVGTITFEFGAPLDPVTVRDDALRILPALPATTTLEEGRFLTLHLHEPPAIATRYTVTADSALRGLRGETLRHAQRSFATAPPQVLHLQQVRTDATEGAILGIAFNAPVNPRDLGKHLTMRWGSGVPLAPRPVGEKPDSELLFRIGPVEHENLIIEISKGLVCVAGSIPMPETYTGTLKMSPRLRFLGIAAEYGGSSTPEIRIRTNHPLDPAQAGESIRIEPAVPFHVSGWRRGLCLTGAFEPGTRYTVTLLPTLAAGAAGTLDEEIRRAVWFGDRPESVRFPFGGGYLSEEGTLLVPLHTVNLDTVRLRTQGLHANNLVEYVLRQEHGTPGILGGKAGESTLTIQGARNEEVETILDLRRLTGGTRGIFALEARRSDLWWEADRAVFVITGLGLSARAGRDGVVAWVTGLADGVPKEGVRVTLLSDRRQSLATGMTDAGGVIRLALPDGRPEEGEPALLVAEAVDGDLTYLRLQGNARGLPGADVGGRPWGRGAWDAYLYTERGVYRGGETVHVAGWVRGGAREVPPEMPLILHLLRPDGETRMRLPVQTDAQGRFVRDIGLPLQAMAGQYEIRCTLPGETEPLGRTHIRIADYMPQRLRMTLQGHVDPVLPPAPGETPTVQLEGTVRYLFGDPAPGLKTTSRVTWQTHPFIPEEGAAWRGWRFGDMRIPDGTRSTHLPDLETGTTGAFRHTVPIPALPTGGILIADATVEAREHGGRALTERLRIPVPVHPFHLGVRMDGIRWRRGQPAPVDLAAVLPDGTRHVACTPYTAEFQRITYSHVLRKSGAGRLQYDRVEHAFPVQAFPGTLTDGWAQLPLHPTEAGLHRLIVTADGGCAVALDLYVDGEGASPSMAHPDAVELRWDKDAYAVGDTATLRIRAPFPGHAFLTVETDRVLHTETFPLSGTEGTHSLSLPPAWRPNAYVRVSVVRPVAPAEDWLPHRADGVIRLPIDNTDRRLPVRVEIPEAARPDRVLPVRIHVGEPEGAVAEAAVTLALVDEGVLALTGHRSPSAWEWFFGTRRLEVTGYDMYGRLAPDLAAWRLGRAPEPGGDSAGGFGLELAGRLAPIEAKRVRAAVLWVGDLRTDAAGMAEATLHVPEYTGTLRLMVVAGKEDRFGHAERALPIRSPLMQEMSLPRALAPGDRFLMPVTILNRTGRDGDARLRLALNDHLHGEEVPVDPVPVPADGEATVWVGLRAGDIGVASIRTEAEMDGERSGGSVDLPVRPPVAFAREGGQTVIRDEGTIRMPEGFLPDTTRTRFVVAGSPLVELTGAAEALLTYPHGCAEQTASRMVPLLYLADILAWTHPERMGAEEQAAWFSEMFLRLRMMQTDHGGLAPWPGGREADPWVSVYVADVLGEAQRAGHAVPPSLLEGLRSYMEGRIGTWVEEATTARREPGRFATAAYACYVLARMGRPAYAEMARLEASLQAADTARQQHPATPEAPMHDTGGGRFHLAAAALACGARDGARTLLTDIPAFSGTRMDHASLGSPIRERAILLSVLLDADPENDHIPALAASLRHAMRQGAWGTTQENAFAVMALGKLVRRKGVVPADGVAILTLPDGETLTLPLRDGVHLDTLRPGDAVRVRVRATSSPADAPAPTDSPPVHVFWHIEGVPHGGRAEETDQGVSIRRTFLSADGKQTVDPASLRHGTLYRIRLTLTTTQALRNLVVTELLPGGLEIEDPHLHGTASAGGADPGGNSTPGGGAQAFRVDHTEPRDDRLLVFGGMESGVATYTYLVRAVTPGTFTLPAADVAGMYDPDIHSVHGYGTIHITR